jgi:Mn-dependent DtxR family transcriptional regulator
MRTHKEEIAWLEERVALANLARDNALAMLDEVQARSKDKGLRANAEVSRLKHENEQLLFEVAGLRADLVAEKARGTRDLLDSRLRSLDVVLAHAAKRERDCAP